VSSSSARCTNQPNPCRIDIIKIQSGNWEICDSWSNDVNHIKLCPTHCAEVHATNGRSTVNAEDTIHSLEVGLGSNIVLAEGGGLIISGTQNQCCADLKDQFVGAYTQANDRCQGF